MSQNSVQTKTIFQSRKHILELLKEQGFVTENYENFSMNEIHVLLQNEQLDMFLKNTNQESNSIPSRKVYIKYHLGKTLRDKNIYEFVEDLFNIDELLNKNDDLIIITKMQPNKTLEKFLIHLWEKEKINVIVFSYKQLQFNITKHFLVSKHIVLSKKESDEFRIKYNIMNDSQIPEISRFDPMAKAIVLKPNQICKIIRQSPTSIESEFYRICK